MARGNFAYLDQEIKLENDGMRKLKYKQISAVIPGRSCSGFLRKELKQSTLNTYLTVIYFFCMQLQQLQIN